jgi:hypothetical protein
MWMKKRLCELEWGLERSLEALVGGGSERRGELTVAAVAMADSGQRGSRAGGEGAFIVVCTWGNEDASQLRNPAH